MTRRLSALDHLLARAGDALAGRNDPDTPPPRPTPAAPQPDAASAALAPPERHHAAGLMRVNHAGEVAAQALYHGQSLLARTPEIRRHLLHAAAEERDHLEWCAERLQQLGEGPSRLQPVWYGASFAMGALAAVVGDRWSLGFVEETEKQVVQHLNGHLKKLPKNDHASRAILEQMRVDEARHGAEARAAGGVDLPLPLRLAMRGVARVMTRTAYWF
ncbi:2-polyprenyl-3-methyl-6-methoxy-1,4-benzoquinone monooxygenase [Algiphilus sp.]|uniref:2-polyprenyl-3-methyl-6-methoxy-1,4-benzoquinone monooxygenase n=1 Tax=Algiphilus sp. TaxID=1872431 RepID=UPI003BABE402